MLPQKPFVGLTPGKPCAVDPALLTGAYAYSLTSKSVAYGI